MWHRNRTVCVINGSSAVETVDFRCHNVDDLSISWKMPQPEIFAALTCKYIIHGISFCFVSYILQVRDCYIIFIRGLMVFLLTGWFWGNLIKWMLWGIYLIENGFRFETYCSGIVSLSRVMLYWGNNNLRK